MMKNELRCKIVFVKTSEKRWEKDIERKLNGTKLRDSIKITRFENKDNSNKNKNNNNSHHLLKCLFENAMNNYFNYLQPLHCKNI